MDDSEWGDDELHGAIDAAEAEDSQEYRERKAAALVPYVLGYAKQWRGLVRRRIVCERAYWHNAGRHTRALLTQACADEVACELAMRHIHGVAEEIRMGGFNYEVRDEREFADALHARMRRALVRIERRKPQQRMLGDFAPTAVERIERSRRTRPVRRGDRPAPMGGDGVRMVQEGWW